MKNLILITSIIDPPKNPLSYSETRSIFNKTQRLDQTQCTIESVKKNIPDSIIVLVECSELTNEENEYFKNNVNFFINMYDDKDSNIQKIYSQYKAECEGTMTVYALDYILKNNISFNALYKISGRYSLTDKFNYNDFNNNSSVVHFINNDDKNTLTCVYKLTLDTMLLWSEFLNIHGPDLYSMYGFENIFSIFIHSIISIKPIKTVSYVGVSGYVSVCGTFVEV
jgi:hypothetical protein